MNATEGPAARRGWPEYPASAGRIRRPETIRPPSATAWVAVANVVLSAMPSAAAPEAPDRALDAGVGAGLDVATERQRAHPIGHLGAVDLATVEEGGRLDLVAVGLGRRGDSQCDVAGEPVEPLHQEDAEAPLRGELQDLAEARPLGRLHGSGDAGVGQDLDEVEADGGGVGADRLLLLGQAIAALGLLVGRHPKVADCERPDLRALGRLDRIPTQGEPGAGATCRHPQTSVFASILGSAQSQLLDPKRSSNWPVWRVVWTGPNPIQSGFGAALCHRFEPPAGGVEVAQVGLDVSDEADLWKLR